MRMGTERSILVLQYEEGTLEPFPKSRGIEVCGHDGITRWGQQEGVGESKP